MLHGRFQVAAREIHLRQGKRCGRFPGVAPGRLGQCVVRLIQAVEIAQRKAQTIECFAIARIGIEFCQRGDGRPEMLGRLAKLAALQMPPPQRRVAAAVAGIAVQGLVPIIFGQARRVAVLLQMLPDQKKFFDRRHVGGKGGLSGGGGYWGLFAGWQRRCRLILNQDFPRAIDDIHAQFVWRNRLWFNIFFHQRRLRRERGRTLMQYEIAVPNLEQRTFLPARGDGAHANLCPVHNQRHRRVNVGLVRRTDRADGIPILTPRTRLAGHQPRKVRLIVGEHACHQFNIGSAVIGKIPVPRVPKRMISPGPLFLARRDTMIRHMHKSRPADPDCVVISAKKILLRSHRHITRRHRNISVPAQVVGRIAIRGLFSRPRTIIHTIILPVAQGKTAHRPLRMIRNMGHIRWEK